MCGPILSNLRQNTASAGGRGEEDDITDAPPSRGRGRASRRPVGSFDYDDETNVTDVTSYDEEDGDTYDGHDYSKKRGGGRSSRGRDRKPRGRSPNSEDDGEDVPDDTDTEFSSVYQKKEKEAPNNHSKNSSSNNKHQSHRKASGFAKRCYFTKAGIGRTTQHYEGLTLTGNTVLMLAAAMKLKGCPTICDEDLRRVEQTYPNQFSRLPDELLLSSGWRRISKYCHFSHKPLPDGCSGDDKVDGRGAAKQGCVGGAADGLPGAVRKAPRSLIEDPNEWTLVNKFCFFSGGPINVEEDVYYRAELGGTEIYILSPEELYRLKPSKGAKPEDNGPLKSVAAVEEIESVYDLTERDFDDLKLYHLGPCRALPPYLLHPEAWTKVLPPHFVAARDEAMRKAIEFEKRFPPAAQPPQAMSRGPQDSARTMGDNSGYVELGGGGRHTPAARTSMTPMGGASMGPAFTPHYAAPPMMHSTQIPMNQDPNAFYPPQPLGGAASTHAFHSQQPPINYGAMPGDTDMNYYYGNASVHQPLQTAMPRGQSPFVTQPRVTPSPNPYGNANLNQSGYSDHHYDNTPPRNNIGDPHWRGIQDEGAFGMNPVIANDQPDDEALATRRVGYANTNRADRIQQYSDRHVIDPPDYSMQHGAYNYNGDEQDAGLKDPYEGSKKNLMTTLEEPTRPNLSTKLGNHIQDEGNWETRTEGESTYGSSLVSGSSYTDTTNPNERNSRRALILQMAKAKNEKCEAG
ncbi:hypothetical protein HJC23_003843 [Cyclotella cryptica]|uniref:Uncharacterized protein n=1 Tax=Cyclotella cryptica TaxID=29204 RepID=A0ABD3PZ68_9STRA